MPERTVPTIHVIPSLTSRWVVRRAGSRRALRCFATKSAALAAARRAARHWSARLVVHHRDGTVERSIRRKVNATA